MCSDAADQLVDNVQNSAILIKKGIVKDSFILIENITVNNGNIAAHDCN